MQEGVCESQRGSGRRFDRHEGPRYIRIKVCLPRLAGHCDATLADYIRKGEDDHRDGRRRERTESGADKERGEEKG